MLHFLIMAGLLEQTTSLGPLALRSLKCLWCAVWLLLCDELGLGNIDTIKYHNIFDQIPAIDIRGGNCRATHDGIRFTI